MPRRSADADMSVRAAPRRSTLLALTTSVLAVHLLLLAGPLPLWDHPQTGLPSLDLSRPDPAEPGSSPDPRSARPALAAPAPVLHSQVRWIAPAAEVAPARPAARPAAPPRPRPAVVPPTPDTPETIAVAPGTPVASGIDPDTPPAPAETSPPQAPAASEPVLAAALPAPVQAPAPAPEAPSSAAVPAPANASAPPGLAGGPAQVVDSTVLPYTVRGEIRGIPYRASARLAWQRDGDRYEATLEVRALLMGSRTQTSVGRVTPQGLQPERFSDRSRSEKAAHFDADGQRIRFSNNAPDAPLLPGAQDRLSVFLQLGSLFNARPQAFVQGQELQLQVAGTGGAETWRLSVGPEETLELPVGPVQARRLSRAPVGAYSTTVEVWLAPGLAHLPVRIRLTQASGDLVDQQLEQWPALPQTDTVRRVE